MRLAVTRDKKARRLILKPNNFAYQAPVWLRRFHDQIGADSEKFDIKHPEVGRMVAGLKARQAASRAARI